jgi:hypothetical protein
MKERRRRRKKEDIKGKKNIYIYIYSERHGFIVQLLYIYCALLGCARSLVVSAVPGLNR